VCNLVTYDMLRLLPINLCNNLAYKFAYCEFCCLQAARADKYEKEIVKLREKLSELDFVKVRLDELRSENHLLLETKQDLEDQLAQHGHEMAVVGDLEKELQQCRQLLEQTTLVRFSIWTL